MVGVENRLDVLGVESLGARREADEVGEEDGDDLALPPTDVGHVPSLCRRSRLEDVRGNLSPRLVGAT